MKKIKSLNFQKKLRVSLSAAVTAVPTTATIALCFIFNFTFMSCTSLQQDVVISTIPHKDIKEISDFEFRLVNIDKEYSFTNYFSFEERNKACDDLIKDINLALSKNMLMQQSQARLTAIKGRAFLIRENFDSAKAMNEKSDSLYKGDIQNLILSHRLKKIEDLSTAHFENTDKAIILIEQAIDFYKAKDYASSVAKFDEAFITAESYYHDAYLTIRDNAWNLREVKDDSDFSILISKQKLNILDMMNIMQAYPKIIILYSDSNKLSDAALFRKLKNAGLLTAPTKSEVQQKIFPTNILTRKMQARFLWNIYCNYKNKPNLKTKYSTLYKQTKRKSPINDVDINDEDFDAILGCIEYDLLQLSDGINFAPYNTVSGSEFNFAMKKLK